MAVTIPNDGIRNIAFAGQSGAGKTSLIESLLYNTHMINQPGEVERGTTVTDFDPQSKKLEHSVETSLAHLDIDHRRVNLLDTPGTSDLMGRSLSVLPAVETMALVVDPHEGLGMVAEQMLDKAKEQGKCRLIIINKIDGDAQDLENAMAALQDRLGAECLPINLPDESGHEVVDCFFEPDYDRPTLFSSVRDAHDGMIDQVVEVDEELMEIYLEQGEELEPNQLHDPFETALRSNHLIPVCFVSARTNAGIELLTRILNELMPTPAEGNLPHFLDGDNPILVEPKREGHTIAHIFKISVDPFMGRLAHIRVHQGEMTPDTQLYIGEHKKPFKVAHLYQLQGKQREEVSKVIAGDICAIAKIDDLEWDQILHDSHDEDHLHLESPDLPPPMYSLAVHPVKRGDEQKLSETLKKLTAEDQSLHVTHKANLNETLLTGIGETHLDIALDKMREQFKLDVETGSPSIDYRETITKAAEARYRHKKQTGGAGQFGEVHLSVRPLERGEGFRFVNKVVGGAIPGQFIPAVEKGVRQLMEEGAIAGFPMQDIEVTVLDGKHHSVDSKEIAFVSAARKAFQEAVRDAGPIILEPIVDVSIMVPSECIGDISGDLSSHRGIITDSVPDSHNRTLIRAQSPLTELADYSHRIKSITRGEGSFTMALSHFDKVPMQRQQELCQDYKVEDAG